MPATEHPGRLGRAAHQEPLARARPCVNALLPKRNQKDITIADRGVPVPEVRARDDVGALPRPRRGAGHRRSRIEHRGRRHRARTTDGRAVAVVAEDADGATTELPVRPTSSRRCRSARCCKAMDPPVAGRRAGRRRRAAATATSSPSRSSCPRRTRFPDNWIYVHSPEVQVGRIQNFGSWSPYMVKEGRTCLGLEYFVFEGDELWSMPDEELIELGKRELGDLGLVEPGAGRGRLRRAHAEGVPVYDEHYKANVDVLRDVARRPTRPTCIPSAATACTSTTTRTTRCTPPCSPSRTS